MEFGRIQQKSAELSKIWQNLTKFGRMWSEEDGGEEGEGEGGVEA